MCLLRYGRRVADIYSHAAILNSFIILTTLLSTIKGQTWVQQPSDKNVTVGGTVKFVCEARDVGARQLIWTKGVNPIFVNGQPNSNVPSRYRMEGNNSLVIENVELSDDSLYSCSIFGYDAVQVKLTVLLPPGPPTVITNSSSSSLYVENSVIQFTCSSSGGKPAPTIQWLRNGQSINSAILTPPPPSSAMGTSSSQITVTLTRSDHRANYTCSVFNAANKNSPLSKTNILDVQYSPVLTFNPSYSPYRVKLNTQITLKCEVDAFPAVQSIEWHKDGQSLPTTADSLSFNSIQKSDSGNYSCMAKNYFQGAGSPQTTTISTLIDVIYAPVVTTTSVITANISINVNMTCHVEANPPAREIRWQKLDNSMNGNGPNFEFIAAKVYDGNYSCTAISRLEPSGQLTEDVSSKGYTTVRIQYAPGRATISPLTARDEGESVTLNCQVNDLGYPHPNYEWRRYGSSTVLQSTTSSTYLISRLTLADNGNYTCLPRNLIGQGVPAVIEVVVNSPPVFVQSIPTNPAITVPISQSNLLLEYKIEGRPLPNIQWTKDGVPLSSMNDKYFVETNSVVVEQYKYRVTTRVTFVGSGRNQNRLEITDMGQYQCSVSSSASSTPDKRTFNLSLQFAPQVTFESRVAAEIGERTTLVCRAQANPQPVFTWYKQGQRLYNSTRITLGQQKLAGLAMYEGFMEIKQAADVDFNDYTCEVNNSEGSQRKVVKLSAKDVPEPPTNLAATRKTWESVMLTWDTGFNGGYEQTYTIVISSLYPQSKREFIPATRNTFNVTRLMPHTSYTFNIYGQNKLGKGSNSGGFTAQTDVLVFPPLKDIPEFHVEEKKLTVPNELNQSYCLRVDISADNGKVWNVVEPCVTGADSEVTLATQTATNVNVSVCLVYRPEVCGEPVSSEIHEANTPDLTETQVIIIGCVCAGILVILLVILIYIICRRRQRKNYTNDPHSPRTAVQGNGTVASSQKPRGYDNQDGVQLETRNGYPSQYLQPNDISYPLGDTSYDSHTIEKYEYEMNRRNANLNGDQYYGDKPGDISFNGSPRTPTKDPNQFINIPEDHHKNEGGSFGSGQESGYSTPDNVKPKKNWRFHGPSFFNLRQNKGGKNKNLRTNPDMVPYSHDPPGHTCGLPCCSGDLQIQLRVRRQPKSCIGLQDMDVIAQNFTFKGKQLMKTRPDLANGFFSVQQPKEVQRAAIPNFGSLRNNLPSIEEDQKYNFLKGRGITLPECLDPSATEKLYLHDFNGGESDDILNLGAEDIEYYMSARNPADIISGVPYSLEELEQRQLYPWDLMSKAAREKGEDSSSSNYYEIINYPDEKPNQRNDNSINSKSGLNFTGIISTANQKSANNHYSPMPITQNPPQPPRRTPLNHPPLPKPKNPIKPHSNPQNSSIFDSLPNLDDQNHPPKFNTYNTVYSINGFANSETKSAYDRFCTYDEARRRNKSLRRDARDIDFTGKDAPLTYKGGIYGSLNKAKLDKILKRNENIADTLRSHLKKMHTEAIRESDTKDTGKGLKEKLIKQENEKTERLVGMVNAGYHGNTSTRRDMSSETDSERDISGGQPFKHLNIDGKIRKSTSSMSPDELAACSGFQEFPVDLDEVLDQRKRNSFSDNPITLIL